MISSTKQLTSTTINDLWTRQDGPYTAPDATIRYGSQGDGVRWLQYMLDAAGYDCGKIDGIAGVKTIGCHPGLPAGAWTCRERAGREENSGGVERSNHMTGFGIIHHYDGDHQDGLRHRVRVHQVRRG